YVCELTMLKCLTLLLSLSTCETVFSKPETATSLNEFRTANGLVALRSDARLTGLARGHAEDMARRGALDHAGFMQRRGARAENDAAAMMINATIACGCCW